MKNNLSPYEYFGFEPEFDHHLVSYELYRLGIYPNEKYNDTVGKNPIWPTVYQTYVEY